MVYALLAITLPLLVDGSTEWSSCTNIQLQEETQPGQHKTIANNTPIYRPLNDQNLTITCQCVSDDRIHPFWSLPRNLITSSICSDVGICITNQTLLFLSLKERHGGYYKCHVNSSFKGFILHVIGQLL